MRFYASIEDARRAFEPFARVEPKLWTLWELCRRAAPPSHRTAPSDDAYDADPFELDVVEADPPDDGWCAEDYFLYNVKSKLLVLVGVHRGEGPRELQTSDAYDVVYDLLLNWALTRACACCVTVVEEPWHGGDDGHRAHG